MEDYSKCGIYKITSPTKRVYIGESKNIGVRWSNYRNLSNCKSQIKLYRSFKKYGIDKHVFEIIEECNSEELKCTERKWQDFYNVLDEGLNCILTNCGDKKVVLSEETLKKRRDSMLGSKNPFYGKKHSEEAKQKKQGSTYR